MAKLTLLDMTQRILSAMDSDDVNSIADTVESEQVAYIIRDCYQELCAQRDWPFLRTLTTLTALGDVTNPTKMRIPTGMNKIYWIKYNKLPVTYKTPSEFKDIIDKRVEATGVVDANGYVINADPQYWTSYDDDYIYFDGYDSAAEASLQASNSVVYGVIVPSWTHEDTFVPTLPEKMFSMLLNDAKSTAFLELKQQAHQKAETIARRSRARFQNEAWRRKDGEPTSTPSINYGRK